MLDLNSIHSKFKTKLTTSVQLEESQNSPNLNHIQAYTSDPALKLSKRQRQFLFHHGMLVAVYLH